MTTTTETDRSSDLPPGHRWTEAGEAWGRRARDWATLFEQYSFDVLLEIFPALGVGPSTSLLDIACGSGLAVRLADGAGAEVAGIDAATSLVDLARERTPAADLRVGTMFALPWDDESFDSAMSLNGIWGGCERALTEAHRVLRPGGTFAMSFWGTGRLDLKRCFVVYAMNSHEEHVAGMRRTADVGAPGVAETMLEAAGFEVVGRGGRVSTVEFADDDIAWRALASVGPAVPALERLGADALRPLVLDAIAACRDAHGGYRLRNDLQYVVARKP